jgi:alpha-L-fucosidase 2
MHALRIDGDLVPVRAGDGSVDGLLAAGGAYTVGMSRQSGRLTEIRLAAERDGTATLRSGMFTAPVRVYRADGRPADHSVDGDMLTLPTRAGESYRVVAQVGLSVEAPDEPVRPGTEVSVTVTVSAPDHRTLPRTDVSVDVPGGWSVEPGRVRLAPVKRG